MGVSSTVMTVKSIWFVQLINNALLEVRAEAIRNNIRSLCSSAKNFFASSESGNIFGYSDVAVSAQEYGIPLRVTPSTKRASARVARSLGGVTILGDKSKLDRVVVGVLRSHDVV